MKYFILSCLFVLLTCIRVSAMEVTIIADSKEDTFWTTGNIEHSFKWKRPVYLVVNGTPYILNYNDPGTTLLKTMDVGGRVMIELTLSNSRWQMPFYYLRREEE